MYAWKMARKGLHTIRITVSPEEVTTSAGMRSAGNGSGRSQAGGKNAKGVNVSEKIRVRELAAELGIGNKEILTLLRQLDIHVKSHMSTLDEQQAALIKEKCGDSAKSSEVIRKEVQPGVIVRRRTKTRKRKADAEAKAEAPVAEKSAEAKKEEAPKAEPVAEATAEPKAESAAEEKKAPAKRKAAAKPVKEEAPKARIIKPAHAEVAEAAEAEKVEKAPASEAPKAKAAPKAETKKQPKEKAPKKTQEKAPVSEAPEAKTPEAAESTPKSDSAPAEEPQAAASETPDQKTPATEEAPKAAQKGKKDEAEAKQGGKKRKKKEKPAAPQVRIISLPENPPAPKPAASTSDSRRPGGRPGGGRPGGGRPGGGRPGGGRPGGGRPGGGRPGGARPGGGRPGAPGAPGAPGMDAPKSDGRGGRRRKKDKRVVEFRNNEFGGRDNQMDRNRKGKKGKKGRRGGAQDDMRPAASASTAPMKQAKRKLKIDEAIRVSDMAHQMGIRAPEIIRILMGLGVMATINQSLDFDTATLVASEFGYDVEKVGFSEDDFLIPAEPDTEEQMKPRPPVVTIMGHVDHGKTSLLDAIRKSNVTGGEAGGITQHIGAYHVTTSRGEIVFLDTPGHEAFTSMRARGAQVTDIVILVVAADDGVMDQTREAINHSKAAGVPIVVAVNKMDKEDANPDRVKRELAEHGLQPEDWGGDTIFAPVSAKTGMGLDDLLEMVALQAEVLELKANPDKPARGHIVEARLDKGRGPVGTLLIQEGTLNQGDAFVCGLYNGKVRAMFNDQGKKIKTAGPAMPVEVQGFDGIPEAGDEFACVADDKIARRIAEGRKLKQRERQLAKETKVTLESFLKSDPNADTQTLNLVLKADVQGSLEAIAEALNKLSTDAVKIDIIHMGAGAITESDILLASASQAIIIGFNVRPTSKIKEVADQEHVEIRFYDIIYKLVAEIKDAMTGMLAPVITEQYLGQAEVRETFSVPKIGVIAGCMVADGKMVRNGKVRLLRDGVVTYTGEVSSLKRFKDDAKEVMKGYECGIGLLNFNDIKVGDIIESFEEVESQATL